MARRNRSTFFEDVVNAPWWVSAILAVGSYVGLKFLMPIMLQDNASIFNRGLAKAGPSMARFLTAFFVLTSIGTFIFSVIKKKK